MSITVKEVCAKFDLSEVELKRLTGKTDFKPNDNIDLSKIESLGNKNLSIWVAEKEGKAFVYNIQDDDMRKQIACDAGIKTEDNAQKNANLPAYIPMDKSVFDYQRPEMA